MKHSASLSHSTLWEKRLRQIFDMCDTDGMGGSDGSISKNELIKAIKKDEKIAEFFHLPKEFRKKDDVAALEKFQQQVDADGDGQMDWEEFKAFYKKNIAKLSKADPRLSTGM